jgi:hypothetical protein
VLELMLHAVGPCGGRREALGCALHMQMAREADKGTCGPSLQVLAPARVTVRDI